MTLDKASDRKLGQAMVEELALGASTVVHYTVAMYQGALARAVLEVLDGGDEDDGIGVHSRSGPNALVGSLELLD